MKCDNCCKTFGHDCPVFYHAEFIREDPYAVTEGLVVK